MSDRRQFLRAAGAASLALSPSWLGGKDAGASPPRFRIGIQQYTFHRWFNAGKLKNEDYPAFAAKEVGVKDIEYYNRPFKGRHKDKGYVKELARRTAGEGLNNLLILVDARDDIDAPGADERGRSLDEHKAWVDCAAQLGCSALRVNARSGGDPARNLKDAAEGIGKLCDYAEGTGVKIVIEPHGGNSNNPDWLLQAMKRIGRANAGLLPDFNNFGSFDRYEGVAKTLPFAPAVCAKAIAFDEAGNETRSDFYRMLKIIHASAFSGVITIEFEGHDLDPVKGSLMTKALLEKAIAAATRA